MKFKGECYVVQGLNIPELIIELLENVDEKEERYFKAKIRKGEKREIEKDQLTVHTEGNEILFKTTQILWGPARCTECLGRMSGKGFCSDHCAKKWGAKKL